MEVKPLIQWQEQEHHISAACSVETPMTTQVV